MFLLGFTLSGTLCTSWIWLIISFSMLGKFSAIISSNIFSSHFSLFSPSGTPIMQMFMHLMFNNYFLNCVLTPIIPKLCHLLTITVFSEELCFLLFSENYLMATLVFYLGYSEIQNKLLKYNHNNWFGPYYLSGVFKLFFPWSRFYTYIVNC